MLCLKEWLELDRIRTEVYEPALNEIIAEMAVRKTTRFFLESMEERDDDGTPGELADPFNGSDEAQPVSSHEEEGTDQDVPDERYDPKMKIRLSDGRVLTSQRDIAKALKDASLWIRWAGMLERTRAIEQLQSMRKEENPSYNTTIKENASGGLGFDDLMKDDFEISKTIPILEKLGYIDVDKLTMARTPEGKPEFSKEQIEEKIRKAFHDATEESGNKIPPGITDEQIEKNADKAKNDFFIILRNFFNREYNQLSRSGRNTGVGGAGIKLYDTDELANKFILRMLDKVSKRQNKQASIKPWVGLRSDKLDFGKVGQKELENDEFVDEILDHFKRLLYKEPSKAEDERRIAMSPSKGTKDEFSNRDKKKSRINVDVKEALKAQAEGKTLDSLKFYIDFLRASKDKIYEPSAMKEEDRFRFEIMSDISYRASTNPRILSLDPSKIIETLQNYRTHYLSRSKVAPSFLSAMGSKNDDGSSFDPDGRTDDERAYGRGATSQTDYGLSGSSYFNPAAQVIGGEQRSSLLEKLRQALVKLKNKNSKWALAVCHKFGLGCGSDGSISSPEKILNFLGAVVHKKAEDKTGCKNQLDAIGLSKQQVAQLIPLDLGSDKQATIDSWIDKGLEFLCQELQRLFADRQEDGTAATSPVQPDLKEPEWKTMERPKPLPQSRPMLISKPSPLARMMGRSQG